MDEAPFRRSTRCTDAGNCVEVSLGRDTIRVRDSKEADGEPCRFEPGEWTTFIQAVKAGAFAR